MGRWLFLWVLRCLCSFHSFFPAGPALSSSQPMCLRGLYVLAGVGVSVPNGVRRRVALDGDGPLVQCDGRRAGAADPAPCRLVPQDVARLIVERSTIMSHLFSKRSCSAESDAVLAALLSIFSRYVQRMRKSKEGEEVYSWVRGRGPAQPRPAPPSPAPRLCCSPPASPAVRVAGPGLPALEQRGDRHHAHPRGPRHGHPPDSGPAAW